MKPKEMSALIKQYEKLTIKLIADKKALSEALINAADEMEAYTDLEEFSHELRQFVKNQNEMTYSDELYLEHRGEK